MSEKGQGRGPEGTCAWFMWAAVQERKLGGRLEAPATRRTCLTMHMTCPHQPDNSCRHMIHHAKQVQQVLFPAECAAP